MGTKIKLTVHCFKGKHYATICISDHGGRHPVSSREVFSIERDISLIEIEDLKKEARLIARKDGISHVYNLDD
jgi:hypothetical protein